MINYFYYKLKKNINITIYIRFNVFNYLYLFWCKCIQYQSGELIERWMIINGTYMACQFHLIRFISDFELAYFLFLRMKDMFNLVYSYLFLNVYNEWTCLGGAHTYLLNIYQDKVHNKLFVAFNRTILPNNHVEF